MIMVRRLGGFGAGRLGVDNGGNGNDNGLRLLNHEARICPCPAPSEAPKALLPQIVRSMLPLQFFPVDVHIHDITPVEENTGLGSERSGTDRLGSVERKPWGRSGWAARIAAQNFASPSR